MFTDPGDSYAARTGRPDNIGVIGIAVFREAPSPRLLPSQPSLPIARAEAAGTASRQAHADAAPQSLGTGHGRHEWAPAHRTEFRAASRSPQQVSQLRYHDARTLIANGILPRLGHPHHAAGPDAFPRDFVPDPPGRWR